MANIIYSSLESWKESNFISLLKDLDSIACDIANDKDQSDVSRKVLIEKNRKFKEQVSLETRKEVAPLLKSFQTEVDLLNKRNKNLETQLLTIYKKLIDLPDPCNALEVAVKNQKKLQKSQDISLENKKLRETLEEYQVEFSGVKNQEGTIKQMRDRIRALETTMAANIELRCKETEREMTNLFAEKERELLKDKIEAYCKVSECENKLALVGKNVVDSQSELFQMKNKFDEFSAAKMSEIEILIDENDRANERIKQLESQNIDRHNFVLSKTAEKVADDKSIEMGEILELQLELTSKENEIIKLNEELRIVHSNSMQNERKMKAEMDQFQKQLHDHNLLISKLQASLESQHDYEEIKKELFIIKSIEFQDLEQSPIDFNSSKTDDVYVRTKSIEQLLNEKNRHLQNELLQMKASLAQLQIEFEKLKDEDHENCLKLREQSQLINQLEDDLRNVKTLSSSMHKLGVGSDDSSQNSVVGDGGQSSIINGANILADILDVKEDISMDLGQNSLLTIVQSQRDRFKIRTQELEANSQIFQQTIQNLQTEMEKIRNDNVKLYEKIRFLQSYSRSSKSPFDDGTMSRYSGVYEANLNPFETFSRHEKQRQYQALPPHEKIMLSLGKFVMGNRTARLFAFLYSLLLHFLIFIVLYKLAYTESCVRDQAFLCRREFAEHMKKAHGR